MAGSSTRRSPSVVALAAAWVLTLAFGVGWSVVLYNYDGEMDDTQPPPFSETTLRASIVATLLVTIAWMAWRLRWSARTGFWVFLIGAFAAKGLLQAGLEEIWVLRYTAAPFTLAGWYRGEALAVATALVSGVVVALTVRAIDAKRASNIDPHIGPLRVTA